MKLYVAIADSRYNENQILVLTTAKKKCWKPVENTETVKVKLFSDHEKAMKTAKRVSLLLSPEIISLEKYQDLKKQIQDEKDHEEAEMSASHEYFLQAGSR